MVIGKSDQYATRDKHGDKRLTTELSPNGDHPADVFYVFLCRVVLGEALETRDGHDSCFASRRNRRELKAIPGTSPSEPHHSLIARVCNHDFVAGGCPHGCCLKPDRFNEFVSFHASRTYPEYLIAYHRQ